MLVDLVADVVADFIQIVCIGRYGHYVSALITSELYQIGIPHLVCIEGILNACRRRSGSGIPCSIAYQLFSDI